MLQISTRRDKKYSYTRGGKAIHFGARGMQHFRDDALGKFRADDHGDMRRLLTYFARHYHQSNMTLSKAREIAQREARKIARGDADALALSTHYLWRPPAA